MSNANIVRRLDMLENSNTVKLDEIKSIPAQTLAPMAEALETRIARLDAAVTPFVGKGFNKIHSFKSLQDETNFQVKSALRAMYKSKGKSSTEIKLFQDDNHYSAFMKEASSLTGSAAGIGGRTAYDPVFTALRLANPLRGVSRSVSTDGSEYMFRSKVGNSGAAWGYDVQNNGAATTESTNIWTQQLQDLNVQFPIRTAALDDIDGLEGNIVSDMLAEFSQAEAQSMIQNDTVLPSTAPYGGANGLRGLSMYSGARGTYTGGTITNANFGSSGSGAAAGLHALATYDQITTNGSAANASNIQYKDVVNFVNYYPVQYRNNNLKWVVSPSFLNQVRALVDANGTPIFERANPLITDGIVGWLLGFEVVVNSYLDNVANTSGIAGTKSLYPAYFGDWARGHAIVDRLEMQLRRYEQTLPSFITFYGEKRLATSVVDPFAIIRYRSTATAS